MPARPFAQPRTRQEHQRGDQQQERDDGRESLVRRHQQQRRAGSAAQHHPAGQAQDQRPVDPCDVAAKAEGGGQIAGQGGRGGGGVGRDLGHPGEDQRRKGDEGAAARDRVQHAAQETRHQKQYEIKHPVRSLPPPLAMRAPDCAGHGPRATGEPILSSLREDRSAEGPWKRAPEGRLLGGTGKNMRHCGRRRASGVSQRICLSVTKPSCESGRPQFGCHSPQSRSLP